MRKLRLDIILWIIIGDLMGELKSIKRHGELIQTKKACNFSATRFSFIILMLFIRII